MDSTAWILIIVAAIIIVALIVAMRARAKRSEALKDRFGPEYERTVSETGDQRAAEKQLAAREERREKLQIRELDPSTRDAYLNEWRDAQTRFVDNPGPAVRDADSLVMNVMRDRGYPVDDFEQRAEDISVDHPHVVVNYRAAHRIFVADEQGRATTEDLRQAMVHYRSLFAELLGDSSSPGTSTDDLSSTGARDDVRVDQIDLREERNPRT